MDKKIILEGCIDNINEIDDFYRKGIDRLELCSNLAKGGLSPKYNVVKYALDKNIDSVIMLREKSNFSLTHIDYLKIKNRIKKYRKLGATKYIFGFVKNNEIDINTCKKIISLLKQNETYSFHMAIDETKDYDKSINQLIDLGFSWVLTKGGKDQALNNLNSLKNIVSKYDSRIKILVGGKVTHQNWEKIYKETCATWFHGRQIK